MSFSGLKDIDREILKWVDDKHLLQVCTINRKTWNEVCDDGFLKRRLASRYPGIEKYKKANETWKRFFLRYVYYTDLMRRIYKFEYTDGNFKTQYYLFKMKMDNNSLLLNAAETGELSLVKHALYNGADLHYDDDGALSFASRSGRLNVVKWLVENGANIHADNDLPLGWASQSGHLDVVKYLVENGADIHADFEYALTEAAEEGHLNVVKYLVENGAYVRAAQNALPRARLNGHTDVVQYLLQHGANNREEAL